MSQIFISYRRGDTAGYARALYDQLSEQFGEEQVFMDVDAIEPGVDFVERIESAVASADAFIALIGRGWVSAQDDEGRRRLDDAGDYVRREVASALRRRDVTVIPVLVGGAAMPQADELPEDLVPLRRRNALVLSDLDWRGGMNRLVTTLEKELEPAQPPPRPAPGPKPAPPPEQPPRRPPEEPRRPGERARPVELLVGVVGAALLVAATALRWDALASPDFGGGTVPNLGFAIAPASLAVAAGAVVALLLAWRGGPAPFETGLLLGFAAGGAAKYAGLGLQVRAESVRPDQVGPGAALALGLAGSLVLAGLAGVWLAQRHRERRYYRVVGRVFAPAGAALMAAATLIPFNVSFPESNPTRQIILRRDVWEGIEPLALAVAVLLVAVLGRAVKQAAVSGALIALGILGAVLWLRYVGVPALQMLERDDLASLRPGGFVGLAGAALVWRAGAVGRGRVLQQEAEKDVRRRKEPGRSSRDAR